MTGSDADGRAGPRGTPALVALGSNLEPRRQTLQAGLDALCQLPATTLVACSQWLETAPVDAPAGSGPFLNGACLLSTELSARELLAALQRIEHALGRRRLVPNGPRTLDLDLILHGDLVLDEPDLQLPHPRAHLRAFVLEPAAEVAPALRHPVLGRDLASLRDALRRGGLDASLSSAASQAAPFAPSARQP